MAQFKSQKTALFLDEVDARKPYCRPFLDFEQFKEKKERGRKRQFRNQTGASARAEG